MYLFSKIHQALGLDQATIHPTSTCSSAAPLNVETFMYFQSLDIIITELLGCTESVAQTTNMAGNFKIKPRFFRLTTNSNLFTLHFLNWLYYYLIKMKGKLRNRQ